MESRALVSSGHVRQAMRSFDGERTEYIHEVPVTPIDLPTDTSRLPANAGKAYSNAEQVLERNGRGANSCCARRERSGRFTAARGRDATARPTRATNGAAICTDREIHGAKMTAALLTVRLTAPSTRGSVGLHLIGYGWILTRRQVLADDRSHECARAHRSQFEQAHLLARQAHLRYRIENHDAEFRMGQYLNRMGTHDAS